MTHTGTPSRGQSWTSSGRKLDRAAEHFRCLHQQLRSYVREGKPFTYRPELDQANERFRVRVESNERPPSDLSLVVGDFVQNLRAALDHLVCSIIEAQGGSPTTSSCFPIFTTDPAISQRSQNRWARQLQGIDEDTVELIKHVQPYRRGSDAHRDALACLQALSNEDKHRVVLQTVTAVVCPEQAPPKLDFESTDVEEIDRYELHAMKPLSDGDLLMEAEISITGPAPRISFQGELPIDLAFGRSLIPAGEFVTMFDRVDVIVAHLANEALDAHLGPHPMGDRLGNEFFEEGETAS